MRLFVGAGPANVFAILWLLEIECKDKIILVEKGQDPINRGSKELLNGFMGAGLFSDGKMVFSDHPDTLMRLVIEQTRHKIWRFIKGVIHKFISNESITISKPADSKLIEENIHNLGIRQSETWHLGTINNKAFGVKIHDYLIEKGVEIWSDTEVTRFDFNTKTVFTDKGWNFKYDVLQIGVGKIGTKLIKEITPCPTKNILSSNLHVGGRLETPYNPRIKYISEKIQYDFKFFKEYSRKVELRTFCVNSVSAYVVQEDFNGRVQYNGHAYGNEAPTKINDMNNFAILAKIDGPVKFDFTNRYIKGPNFNFKSTVGLTHLKCSDWNSLGELRHYFVDFVMHLNKELDLNGNYLFFLPEIKENPGVLNVNNKFELIDGSAKDVKWVGDSSVGTRGIVPAIVSGIAPYID